MPDIDPAALSRIDSVATANPSALSLSKINGVSALPVQKATKTVSTAQRIDLEPLYTSLKAAIGDNWGKYKEAISLFVLGRYSSLLGRFRTFDSGPADVGALSNRSPEPERACLPNRPLCDHRSKHRTSAQSINSWDIWECQSRPPGARGCAMGFSERQAYRAFKTRIWRCCGAKAENRGHAITGQR